MQQLLEQLYNGEIYPPEQLNIHIQGYKDAKKIALEAHQAFEAKLSQPMKDEFDAFLSKNSDVIDFEEMQLFIDGFKLATRLMLEIFQDDRTGRNG